MPEATPSPGPTPEFVVPPSTRLVESAAVAAVEPGASDGQLRVLLAAGQDVPGPGGHLAIGPAAGLQDGMFAKVLEVSDGGEGATRVLVEPAPVDEVLQDVDYAFDGPVTPRLVDENGQPVTDGSAVRRADGSMVLRGTGRADGRGMFDCKGPGGSAMSAPDLWGSSRALPIEIAFENPHVNHRFDAGSILLGREPFLLFQLNVEPVATISFQAKRGFSCELTDQWRRNHRFQFPLRNIGPVPVVAYLEPRFEFSVTASGGVKVKQRHYVTVTLEKNRGPLDFRIAHGKQEPEIELGAQLSASVFAGGELSLLVGSGTANRTLGAGLYGGFGPEFALETDTQELGCAKVTAKFRADLGARLAVWTRRWDLEFGSLTTPSAVLARKCGLPDGRPRADLRWNNATDVDLHIWDEQGRHAYFGNLAAVPGARLALDVIDGYGPEEFFEDESRGRRYTYGICQYSGSGSATTLKLVDPGGGTRTFHRTLSGSKAAALMAVSPASGPAYVPPVGWCGANDPTVIG